MAVTLDEAKLALHITDPARDAEVQMYLDQATAFVTQYIGPVRLPEAPEDIVDAAVMKLLGHLYEHRGDDAGSVFGPDTKIWETLSEFLMRTRDPAVS
jgi:hypothetical protein